MWTYSAEPLVFQTLHVEIEYLLISNVILQIENLVVFIFIPSTETVTFTINYLFIHSMKFYRANSKSQGAAKKRADIEYSIKEIIVHLPKQHLTYCLIQVEWSRNNYYTNGSSENNIGINNSDHFWSNMICTLTYWARKIQVGLKLLQSRKVRKDFVKR